MEQVDLNRAKTIRETLRTSLQTLETLIDSIESSLYPQEPEESSPDTPSSAMAWGKKVSATFRERVQWIAETLGTSPDYLMACMAWESGETFRADIKNAAGSGATGLIQFMPTTARALGTTVQELSRMTPEDQLNFVYKYFRPFAGRLNNLGDVYMAILWPKGVGKPDSYVLFDRAKTLTIFRQNAGLDGNKDGRVTRGECLVKINQKLGKGRRPEYVG